MDLNAAMNVLTALLLSNVLVAYLGLEFDSGERIVSVEIDTSCCVLKNYIEKKYTLTQYCAMRCIMELKEKVM